MHDTARPPTLTPGHPLYHKALAVRLQQIVHEQTIQLAEAQARLAMADRQAMAPGLAAIERELREALDPPEGATFNWQTLTFDAPAPAR